MELIFSVNVLLASGFEGWKSVTTLKVFSPHQGQLQMSDKLQEALIKSERDLYCVAVQTPKFRLVQTFL